MKSCKCALARLLLTAFVIFYLSFYSVPTFADCPSADLTSDCLVDFKDIYALTEQWLSGTPSDCATSDLTGDCYVDFDDFSVLASQWQVYNPIDFNQSRTQILNGVSNIINVGVPGNVTVFGSQSFGVFHDGAYNPKIAAGAFGKGKVLVFGHPGYMDFTNDGNDTGQLYLNIVKWLSGTQELNIRIISNNTGTISWLQAKGFSNVSYYSDWENHLASVRIAIIQPGFSLTDSQIASLFEYVANGGGLLIGHGGWILESYGGYKLPVAPINKLLYPMGIAIAQGYNMSTTTSNTCTDYANALTALNVVTKIQSFPEKTKAEAIQSLNLILNVIPNYCDLYNRILGIMLSRTSNLFPNPSNPISDAVDRLSLRWESAYIENQPIDKISAHRAAEIVYGAVPAEAPRISKTIYYSVTETSRDTRGEVGDDVWLSTGMYAVPGEICTVTIDASMINFGLRIKINGDWNNISDREYYLRMPFGISRDFPMVKQVTQAANAYGGLIYIVVPKNVVTGPFDVTIKDAIEAPYFILGQHSNQDWIDTIRDKPAPWAELEANNIIITLSSDKIRNVQDAEKLMTFWETGITVQDILAGTTGLRTRPERMYSMIQTAWGGGYAGYPIGAWDWNFAQDSIYDGDCWGEFHELGHWHQSKYWTDSRNSEVTVNVFTMRAIEATCESGRATGYWGGQWDPYQRILLFQSALSKGGFADGDYGEKLVLYSQLKEIFGWQAFQNTFLSYREANEVELPHTDQEEWDQWMCRFSQQVGYDLSPFFISWNYGVSQSAINSIAYLPKWNMVETVKDSLTTLINTPVVIPDVIANDYSFDNVLHLEGFGTPLYGSIVVNPDNSISYIPKFGYVGKDTLRYTVSNGFGNAFDGIVEITVANIETELIAHWPFETNAYDYSGGQSDGMISGNHNYVPGRIGKSLHFDGISNKAFFGTKPSLSGYTDFTISAWIKTDSHTGGVIIQQRDGDYNGEYYCRVNPNGTLYFMVFGGGSYQFSFNSARIVNDGVWHNVVFMRKDGMGHIYIDGGLPDASANGTTKELKSTISVCIGADQRDNSYYFSGDIDDVAIWNRALLSSEIQQIFDAGLSEKTFRIFIDGSNGFTDFAKLANWWLIEDCRMCGGTDLNKDGSVDYEDIVLFVNSWLE